MTLSNCPDCKYNGDGACGVNPAYREVRYKLDTRFNTDERPGLEALIAACKDWEPSPELEPLTLSITLTQREWLAIAQVKSASKNLVPQVREAINFTPPEPGFDDIPF